MISMAYARESQITFRFHRRLMAQSFRLQSRGRQNEKNFGFISTRAPRTAKANTNQSWKPEIAFASRIFIQSFSSPESRAPLHSPLTANRFRLARKATSYSYPTFLSPWHGLFALFKFTFLSLFRGFSNLKFKRKNIDTKLSRATVTCVDFLLCCCSHIRKRRERFLAYSDEDFADKGRKVI